MKKIIIIGAGLSGLVAAKNLLEKQNDNVLILEKSRGVGGRIATRRTLDTRFDHGAQFYKITNDILPFHNGWKKENLSEYWYTNSKGEHWNSPQGLTALAKQLAISLNIKLETLVKTLAFKNGIWTLTSDKGEIFKCDKLIISAPIPQALELIERSNINELINQSDFHELKNIKYSKALVALLTLEDDLGFSPSGYQEFNHDDIFSISDQKIKKVSTISALTLTMNDSFSEKYFDELDETTLAEILNRFKQKYPEAKIKSFELKKWRYCKPGSTYKNYFCEIAPSLFLIGDSFGGSSLSGAIRSANALTDTL